MNPQEFRDASRSLERLFETDFDYQLFMNYGLSDGDISLGTIELDPEKGIYELLPGSSDQTDSNVEQT